MSFGTAMIAFIAFIIAIGIQIWNIAKPIIIANKERKYNGGKNTTLTIVCYIDAIVLVLLTIVGLLSMIK